MNAPALSVVIPFACPAYAVRTCLVSLADSLKGIRTETHLVSGVALERIMPETAEDLAMMERTGREHFGPDFHGHGPAAFSRRTIACGVNQAVMKATGEYILVASPGVLFASGWLEPLLEDMARFPELGAVSPILVERGGPLLGPVVAEAGYAFSKIHGDPVPLYRGVPASSPLMDKRRWFQAVSRDCLLIRRGAWLAVGGFDEHLVNGHEEIALGVNLQRAGFKLTVNPLARLEFQDFTAHAREENKRDNYTYLTEQRLWPSYQDYPHFLRDDELEPALTPWHTWEIRPRPESTARFSPLLEKGGMRELGKALRHNPLWREGWFRLLELLASHEDGENVQDRLALWKSMTFLFSGPEVWLAEMENRAARGKGSELDGLAQVMLGECFPLPYLRTLNERTVSRLKDRPDVPFLEQCRAWRQGADRLEHECFLPFFRRALPLLALTDQSHSIPNIYYVWLALGQDKAHAPEYALEADSRVSAGTAPPAFSVIMPVYNPDPGHLAAAVESLLAQTWPHWELCMADDCSTDPAIRPLLESLLARDSRIKVMWRNQNGNISAASNSALSLATNPWTALMDQDDLLVPDALATMAGAIVSHPGVKLLFSDEDKITDSGLLREPYCKTSLWNPELLLAQNYVSHLGVYDTARLRECGAFREGFHGSQDHDMVLRFTDNLEAGAVVHVPRVLYHWRIHASSTSLSAGIKPEAAVNGLKAVNEALARRGIQAEAVLVPDTPYYLVHDRPAEPLPPLVVIRTAGGTQVEEQNHRLWRGTAYGALTFLMPGGQGSEPPQDRWQTANLLAERATAEHGEDAILVFIEPGALPVDDAWASRLAGLLARKGVGLAGGRFVDERSTVRGVEYGFNPDGSMVSWFVGNDDDAYQYYNWPRLPHAVQAVDPRLMAIRAGVLRTVDGFDPAMGEAAPFDVCLRLAATGLRCVVNPFAAFRVEAGDGAGRAPQRVDNPAFYRRWQGKVPSLIAGLAWRSDKVVLDWKNNG